MTGSKDKSRARVPVAVQCQRLRTGQLLALLASLVCGTMCTLCIQQRQYPIVNGTPTAADNELVLYPEL